MGKPTLKTLRAFLIVIMFVGPQLWADPYEGPPESIATVSNLPKLAIIIDDIGNSLHRGLDAIALPGAVSFAVMPHRKHSHVLAERAGRLGKDVLLHAPMSTQNGFPLGSGALHAGLSEKAFKDKLRFAIDSMPYVTGMNNHMGSKLTTKLHAMAWVMEVAKEKQLFFVDSRTHADSVAFSTAKTFGIATAQRDVFLDNEANLDHIHQQFKKALNIASQYGSAILIGHPYPETIYYLQHVLPQLKNQDIELVGISKLLDGNIKPRGDIARLSPPIHSPELDQILDLILQKQTDHATPAN